MNFMVGFGGFLGAGLGSLIALLQIPFMNTILFIFLVTGVLRLLIAIFGLRYLKEVRNVEEFSSEFVLNELNPIEGLVNEVKEIGKKKHKVEHYI
jgi:hypothetical protein